MAGVEKNWYVLQAIGGKELKAKEAIEAEVEKRKLHDLVGQCVVPVEKSIVQKNGKKVVKETVLYSGYVFIECALVPEVQGSLVNLPNVIRFVEIDGSKSEIEKNPSNRTIGDRRVLETTQKKQKCKVPWKLRPSEVARMIGKVDEVADDTLDIAVPFIVGETVKVTDGPFNGFSGVIEKIDEEKKMLEVLVKIFGRPTALELSYTHVEKE